MQDISLIIQILSAELNTKSVYIQNVIDLLEHKNTIAFIARYKKAMTNNMDEQTIKTIADRFLYLQKFHKRQEYIINSLMSKNLLDDGLKQAILNANTMSELETIYHPYMSNKITRAQKAIDLGFKPLADIILANNFRTNVKQEAQKFVSNEIKDTEQIIGYACDIIAEIIARDPTALQMSLKSLKNYGFIKTKLAKPELDPNEKYHLYYDWQIKISHIKPYQMMAINRAEQQKILTIKMVFDEDYIIEFMSNKYHKKRNTDCAKYIQLAAKDGLKRLLFPSVANNVFQDLYNYAQSQSIKVFSTNLKHLLLTKPLLSQTVLGIDPGFAHGCKLAIINENNQVIYTGTVFPHPPVNKKEKATNQIIDLITTFNVQLIAIGNKTASSETLIWINELLQNNQLSVPFTSVNEDGASAYSITDIAAEEHPDVPINERSAISIARRVINPLNELIKIDPHNIGVGQYQHDVNNKELNQELDYIVSSCVNNVGVDVNQSNKYLLAHISGMNKRAASSIQKYLNTHQTISSRDEIKNIPYVTALIYQQTIGFLRVINPNEVLDQTIIHPDDYPLAHQIMCELHIKDSDIQTQNVNININDVLINQLADQFHSSFWTVSYILNALAKPYYDIRTSYNSLMLWNKLKNWEDLEINQIYNGVVSNVTDFGVFIDIGLAKQVFAPNKLVLNQKNLFINQKVSVKIDKININKQQVVVMVI
ncbi:helix-hairpin-helix domain-containing protein [Ureaplasma sp. ES3154-GEN]|uniref:Tex-like N-terminal domain-containing protein n=1 Tax=Ureaplasma sp. ES3154-GEN TaxID=2984844 RepID=UPI0021E763C8|nr:Tex-like N-terminal domain-containing protein [Ureaplasma sp. ES3154-GEN]MCV3743461.1 helix-hairpin-helix domain-containing protein [Ureaplasma sp. ES3154-GEN]